MVELAIAGLVIGLLGGFVNAAAGRFQEMDEAAAYEKEAARLEAEKQENLSLLDLEFQDAKHKAEKAADRSDADSTLGERILSGDLKARAGELSLQQIADTYSFNSASKNAGTAEGAALAATAGNGTRTGSIATAVELEAARHADELQAQEDFRRQLVEYQQASFLNSVLQGTGSIQNARTDAVELRKRYAEGQHDLSGGIIAGSGGAEWEKYYRRRIITESGYNNRIDDYSDAAKDLRDVTLGSLRALGRFLSPSIFSTASSFKNFAGDLMVGFE